MLATLVLFFSHGQRTQASEVLIRRGWTLIPSGAPLISKLIAKICLEVCERRQRMAQTKKLRGGCAYL